MYSRKSHGMQCRLSNLAALALVLVVSVKGLAFAEEVSRPNIVVFLSDDHTWRDSSVYGATDIATPNMQRLANAGMTFDRAFVASPSCAPSRAALLTGLYPPRNGAEANHSRPGADIKKLPAYLQEIGYEVVAFGKVGHYRQTTEYGFDFAKHFNYHEDVAVSAAIDWLEERDSTKPLCLFVGTNWPHVPWPEDVEGIDPEQLVVPPNHADTPASRQWRARYVAAIRKMDTELGEVFDAARRILGEETFFLHTSDHGAQWPYGKWNLYEDGVRTPLIVAWPGRVEAGVRSNAMVSWVDILPTLLDVAGGSEAPGIDGRSFLKVATGEADEHRDTIFTTHSGDGDFNVFPMRSVRKADGWKYIRNLHPEYRFNSHVTKVDKDNGYWQSWAAAGKEDETIRDLVRGYVRRPREELYDTQNDPYERRNLANDENAKDRLLELRQSLDQWLVTTGDEQKVFGNPQFCARAGSPNIITVFIDDMGWTDLSCFGGSAVVTENIDRLAAEGLRFTSFYVNAPICSPSRVALSTGQYPHRHRITSYLADRRLNEQRGVAQWLDPKAPMLARELQSNGYATGHFGKWHMGGQRDVGDAPLIRAYGFDQSLTNFEGLGPRVLPLKDAYDGKPPGKHDLGSAALGKGPIRWEDRSQITTSFVDAALQFIDDAQVTGQPFFINLWPDDVHSPFFPPKEKREASGKDKRALYNAVLDTMDEQLGVLFERVRQDPELRDNTLILVCSDNGHEQGAGNSDPLRGGKTWLYEGGIRSPLIVWGPRFTNPERKGQAMQEPVFCALDLNRSLYSLCGVHIPADTQLDGEDVLQTLLGFETKSRQSPIFWRRPPDRPGEPGKDNPDLAVRAGKWKYLVNYDGSDPQLYDLIADPSEMSNLLRSEPSTVDRLHRSVMEWNRSMPPDAGDPQWDGHPKVSSLESNVFTNPIGEGADPWVIRDPNKPRYLWCFSEGNRAISVHTSERLTSFGEKHVVWRAPDSGPYSQQVWAPELHWINDRWYIYFAASDGDNANHLTYVLRSETDDPVGAYELFGPLATGDGNSAEDTHIWAIDMTILKHQGRLYAIWSGWDVPGSDRQFLYIASMESPIRLAGKRIKLCENDDYIWERIEPEQSKRGLNEAPQVFQTNRVTALFYSCGASWLSTYKLGMLELIGDDPLNPDSWKKRAKPQFQGDERVVGVGHSCFVKSADRSQWWHVYHAKQDSQPGWRRGISIQPMQLGQRGYPILGEPIQKGIPIERPAGEVISQEEFSSNTFDYFGHHQFFDSMINRWELGRLPGVPVNAFRTGEKVIFSGRVPTDFSARVSVNFHGNLEARDAGFLFRTTGESLGYDAQRGYFAGLIPKTNLVILGMTDGKSWHELARAEANIDPKSIQQLEIKVRGSEITIEHNGVEKLRLQDSTFLNGRLGLRVVDTYATFEDLEVTSLK